MPSHDDLRLLKDCLDGKAGAWDRLWARHAEAVRQAVAARLGSESEAEEVRQRLFLKLAADGGRGLAGFRGRCRLGTWLVGAALREATDLIRSEARLRAREAAAPRRTAEIPTPLLQICQAEDAGRLRAVLDRAPARDRLLLSLLYWDGASHAEAARFLGVSPHSVTTLLQRALARLRESLKETP